MPTLKKIPTSKFARGFKMAKLTASVGAQALGNKMLTVFADKTGKDAKALLSQIKQARQITKTLSEMKGAAMKLGQILSIHGQDLFPKEVLAILAQLQQSSTEMQFDEIEKVLCKELGAKLGSELIDVSKKPIASASIGQVHRAIYAPAKLPVAVKVQYPGVDKSIDSDVDSLASVLSVLTRIPSVQGFNAVTDEIKMILRQETDYLEEGKNIEIFRNYFAKDRQIIVPKFIAEVSTKRVLTTELYEAMSVQEFADSSASVAARTSLGQKFLEVFYNELLVLGRVQTDPNFGNYKVENGNPPKLVLLDFGAVKVFSKEFVENYKVFMRACLVDDYDGIRDCAIQMGFLRPNDSKELVDLHYDLVKMFMEPFEVDGPYHWSQGPENSLAERIRKYLFKFVIAFKLRPPPRDIVFLDRKVAGVYFFLSAIKAEFNPRELLEKYSK